LSGAYRLWFRLIYTYLAALHRQPIFSEASWHCLSM